MDDDGDNAFASRLIQLLVADFLGLLGPEFL
jgi:hypothetical protein